MLIVDFILIIFNNLYVKKKLSLFILLFFLTACFASNNRLVSSGKIYPGMNKYELNFIFAYQSILENPLLPLSYREYFNKERMEILSDDNDRNIYYVFKNVNQPVTCGWIICKFGDGVLDDTFYNYNLAVNHIKKTTNQEYISKKTVTIQENNKNIEVNKSEDTLSKLKKASDDYRSGKITEAEFEKIKEDILR